MPQTWDDSEDLYGDITDARSKDDGGEKAVEGEAEDMQKAKFEELKRLREEAEVVWEKKENVIRSQQATIGTMIESTTNPKQLALLEAKMKDLDAKLEEIKADKAKSTISITSGGVRGSGRGARGGRFGRGRGRHSSLGFRGSGVSTYVRGKQRIMMYRRCLRCIFANQVSTKDTKIKFGVNCRSLS